MVTQFLGLSAPDYHYVGLVADAVESTDPQDMGLDYFAIPMALKEAGDDFDAERFERAHRLCLKILKGGHSYNPEKGRRDMVRVLRQTEPSDWAAVVAHVEHFGWPTVGGFFATSKMRRLEIASGVSRFHPQPIRRDFGADAELNILLDALWNQYTNPEIPEDESGDLIYEWMAHQELAHMQRLNAALDLLADDILFSGLPPVVMVAAHGETDILSIQKFLERGFLVISREITPVHILMLERFPFLRAYVESGQFVLSPSHCPHPDLPYSLSIWLAPYVAEDGWLYGRFPPIGIKDIAENVVSGGKIVMLTRNLVDFFDPENPQEFPYTFLWGRVSYRDDYLFPSTLFSPGRMRVGIFRK